MVDAVVERIHAMNRFRFVKILQPPPAVKRLDHFPGIQIMVNLEIVNTKWIDPAGTSTYLDPVNPDKLFWRDDL